ncbi:sulfatase family protein [Paramicrobacterium fandaimingii]|uniref:sulfatase family protein n=1 Tax=Paramicrobacterium fandaimingii TaxID=2708079 RepID=UPI0023EDB0E9|nr:sulfatase-like hydrolase/transferase [Microbacterium fandaimingii]
MTSEPGRQPNILLIMADQLGAHVLDRDAEFSDTPHLNRLAQSGADFERAYVSFPLCVPSRASMLTGRMPHELGIAGNAPDSRTAGSEPALDENSLGHVLRRAGYDCAYAGKWHATSPSAPDGTGFAVLSPFGDSGLADACAEWIRARNGETPYFLCASFDDPHTICEYARRQPMPYGDTRRAPIADAPPLPANFEPAPFEPEAVRFEKHAAQNIYATERYTPEEWREYRYAYRQLISRFDGYVGTLLRALGDDGAENTIVIVTSDHGDGDASHRWNQKTALFEECVRVPLIVAGPGIPRRRQSDPVSVSLDLLPTLYGLAGASETSDGTQPSRLGVPLPLGARTHPVQRDIVVQTRFERPGPPLTRGRALYAGTYKYTVYSWGRYREQLHDIERDPGEQRNLAVESRYDDVLNDLRMRLLTWCRDTDDTDALKFLVVPASADDSIRSEIFAIPY